MILTVMLFHSKCNKKFKVANMVRSFVRTFVNVHTTHINIDWLTLGTRRYLPGFFFIQKVLVQQALPEVTCCLFP